MTVLLTTIEAAQLESITTRALVKRINQGKIVAVTVPTQERAGYEHRVALSDLSAAAQARYTRAQQVATPRSAQEARLEKTLDDLTDKQRAQVAHWKRILMDWRRYISDFPLRTTAATADYLEQYNRFYLDMPLTERTLRHKWKLLRTYGEIALADGRADRSDKGKSSIPDIAWSVFLQWWLDESQPTVLHCYNLLHSWAKLDMPQLLPLPSVDSFYRAAKDIPLAAIKLFRYGEKAFEDQASPYLQRLYSYLDSNDVWVSDYHTLDIFVRDDDTGEVYRPHAVVWQDVRSRKMLSLTLCQSSNSDGVISAFRAAVSRFGVPKSVYLDNGREFLVSDFGGRGKRKTAAKPGYGVTILERLGVTMVNAHPGNARAKIVERAFRTLKEQFSRLYVTFSGGKPQWKPERLEGELKRGKNVPLLSEVREQLRLYLEGWYNKQSSEAEGLNGLTPDACYEQNLLKKRTATQEQLDAMLLRSSRTQLVDRDGVYVKIGDTKLWYYNADLIFTHLKQPVFVRYNPDDLSSVRVENEAGQYLLTAERAAMGGYDAANDVDAIKRVAKAQKEQLARTTGYLQQVAATYEAPNPMDVLTRTAQANLEADPRTYNAPVIEPIRYDEPLPVQRAAGAEDDNLIDLGRMIENAKRRKGADQ